MKKAALLFVLISTCNFMVAQNSHYFIKFEGIDGESKDSEHREWCDLESFNQQIHIKDNTSRDSRTATRDSRIAKGKTISVVKKIDKASPKIMESLTSGQRIPEVNIDVVRRSADRNKVYYQYELKEVFVTKYNIKTNESDRPTEEITLKFEEQKVIYTLYDNRGQVAGRFETVWSGSR